jgi:hypothetical protein
MSRTLVLAGVFTYLIATIVEVATISTIEQVRGFEAYRERTERAIAELKGPALRVSRDSTDRLDERGQPRPNRPCPRCGG